MLVITRKIQEKVHIGNSITVTIVRVKGKAVRLGIEAPEDVRVMRSELAASMALRDHAAETKDSSGTVAPLTTGLHERVSQVASRRTKGEKPVDGTASSQQRATSSAVNVSGFADPMRLRRPQRMGPSSLRTLAGCR
jgi:carbon storage regulator CsrA